MQKLSLSIFFFGLFCSSAWAQQIPQQIQQTPEQIYGTPQYLRPNVMPSPTGPVITQDTKNCYECNTSPPPSNSPFINEAAPPSDAPTRDEMNPNVESAVPTETGTAEGPAP